VCHMVAIYILVWCHCRARGEPVEVSRC
jgi:hypothetical protein